MFGVYKVESQHVLSIKSKSNVCIKSPGRVKNIKLDVGFLRVLVNMSHDYKVRCRTSR